MYICAYVGTRVDLERDYIFGKVQTNLQAHIPAKLFEFDVFDWLKLCFVNKFLL